MLLECSHCGAPLDVRDSSRLVTCAYCDHVNRVRSMQTIATDAPPGWTPPQQWTPPPGKRVRQPLAYHQVEAPRRRLFPVLGLLLPLLAAGASIVFGVLPAVKATGALPEILGTVGVRSWDGAGPFRCGGNDNVVIENVTAALPRDTAITVEDNCELRLIGSTITARRGIRAGGNRRVVIENSRIETTGTAIWADGNKNVEIIDSEVIAHEVGIRVDGNVDLVLTGGRVSGAPPLALSRRIEIDTQRTELVDLSPPAERDQPRRSKRSRRKAE